MKLRRFSDWFLRDKNGRVVIWQFPNLPLWAWLGFSLLAHIIHNGRAHTALHFFSDAALVTWAYLEVASGASKFRRVLGAGVLCLLAIAYLR